MTANLTENFIKPSARVSLSYFFMTTYNHIMSGGTVLGGQAEYSFSNPNCHLLYEDVRYFIDQSENMELDEAYRKRYARSAIVFLAFYFESLANLLTDDLARKSDDAKNYLIDVLSEKDDWPKPLNKLLAVLLFLMGHALPSEEKNNWKKAKEIICPIVLLFATYFSFEIKLSPTHPAGLTLGEVKSKWIEEHAMQMVNLLDLLILICQMLFPYTVLSMPNNFFSAQKIF